MKQYKLLASDIDGTLLDKNRELSVATIEQLTRIKKDVPIVLISSRMPAAMRHLQVELGILDLPLVCYNGGLILSYKNNLEQPEVVHSTPISLADTAFLVEKTRGTEVHISLYRNDEWYVESMDYWAKREQNNTKVTPTVADFSEVLTNWQSANYGPHKIMCMGPEDQIQAIVDALAEQNNPDLNAYRSKPTYLEIAHKAINKATALETLRQHEFPDLEAADMIAFGDNYNDMELLEYVGCGVAVANAKAEVLAVANVVAKGTNKEDGVAEIVAQLFL